MYNSRRLSRSTRTLQRRKVDTGITIDPTKVQAYKNYLLNNGYVQLPRPPCPPPDGTYLFTSNADYDVSHLVSQTIYADEFIASVLSTQNISLTGTETVCIALETRIDIDSPTTSDEIVIANAWNNDCYSFDLNFNSANPNAGPFIFLFVYCNGQYSIIPTYMNIVLSSVSVSLSSPSLKRTRLMIADSDSLHFINPKVTIVTVGIQ